MSSDKFICAKCRANKTALYFFTQNATHFNENVAQCNTLEEHEDPLLVHACKASVTEMALDICEKAIMLHGGTGYMEATAHSPAATLCHKLCTRLRDTKAGRFLFKGSTAKRARHCLNLFSLDFVLDKWYLT